MARRWLLDELHKFSGRRAPRKVLVIDDEEVSRYLLRQLFHSPPDQVIEASNGAEGLRFARDEQPQLILLDLLMPDSNGFEVLERLRAEPTTAEIPVVISTSRPLNERARAAGVPRRGISPQKQADRRHRRAGAEADLRRHGTGRLFSGTGRWPGRTMRRL